MTSWIARGFARGARLPLFGVMIWQTHHRVITRSPVAQGGAAGLGDRVLIRPIPTIGITWPGGISGLIRSRGGVRCSSRTALETGDRWEPGRNTPPRTPPENPVQASMTA
jgi:hypothetical protein